MVDPRKETSEPSDTPVRFWIAEEFTNTLGVNLFFVLYVQTSPYMQDAENIPRYGVWHVRRHDKGNIYSDAPKFVCK